MDITEKADSLLVSYTGEVPGTSIAVVKGGKTVLEKSYGCARVPGVHSTPATNYRLASLSKAFTAVSVLKLVDVGKLGLDDALSGFFPGSPRYMRGITLRHMLNHTSGIADYDVDVPESYTGQVHEDYVVEKVKSFDATYFTPGSKFQYSNTAYVLLAQIVAQVSGVPYPHFVEREIFEPLGMAGTRLYGGEGLEIRERAYGYTQEKDGFGFNDQSKTSATLGDGCVYSSISDLVKWDAGLSSGRLLRGDLLNAAFSPGRLNDGSHSEYGFGWFITSRSGLKILHHAGETAGFLHKFIRVPEKRAAIVILTNRDSWGLAMPKHSTEVEDTLELVEYFDLLD
jgi:CubicO group peptidase (beta-lactamase class C family)